MIYHLPQQVINQIAAGEVVERPASVVKELLENALDAQATHITISILDGGSEEITISDNGTGIPPEDLPSVFSPHATSKIHQLEDLNSLLTMGFRGEALASIGAVSETSLVSKTSEHEYGYQLTNRGGECSSPTPIPMSMTGSTFTVKRLFYNVPARKKFLKTRSTELGHITKIIENVALIHPSIAFDVYSENRHIASYPITDQQSRVAQVFSLDSDYLFPITYLGTDLQVQGIIGHPRLSRKHQTAMRLYANQRPIQHNALQKAIVSGFDTMLEVGFFPISVVEVSLDPHHIDVNIHPRKTEVKFHNERQIFSSVREAVRKSLSTQAFSTIQKPERSSRSSSANRSAQVGHSSSSSSSNPVSQTSYTSSSPSSSSSSTHSFSRISPQKTSAHVQESSSVYNPFRSPQPQKTSSEHTSSQTSFRDLLTSTPENIKQALQIFDTYLIYKNAEGIMILDQHAVHEKILLETFMDHPETIRSQALAIPLNIQVPASYQEDVQVLLSETPGFQTTLDTQDSSALQVTHIPTFLAHIDRHQPHIQGIIDQIIASQGYLYHEDIRTELYKTIACRSAIKAGKPLSQQEIEALVNQAQNTQFGFACCHGRPTMVHLDKDWFEKQFDRK